MTRKKYKYDRVLVNAEKTRVELHERFGTASQSLNVFFSQATQNVRTSDSRSISKRQALSSKLLVNNLRQEFNRSDAIKDAYAKSGGATITGMEKLENLHQARVFNILKRKIMYQKRYGQQTMKDLIRGEKDIKNFDEVFDQEKDAQFVYFDSERVKEISSTHGYDTTDLYLEFARKNRAAQAESELSADQTIANKMGISEIDYLTAMNSMTTEEWDKFSSADNRTDPEIIVRKLLKRIKGNK